MRRGALILVVLMSCATVWAIDTATLSDPALRARYDVLTEELRCLVCQNQTIADSNAELAVDLRTQVRDMLQAGRTDDEIRDYMTQRYGDFVLYKPPMRPRTVALWFAPALGLLLGAFVLYRVVRQVQRIP
ncbi:MAG: cytochrome c-type biogenesis protein, partial [Pseudomonadota bacterium]